MGYVAVERLQFDRLFNSNLQLFFPFRNETIISGLKKVRGLVLMSLGLRERTDLRQSSPLPVPSRAATRRPPAVRLLTTLSTSSPLRRSGPARLPPIPAQAQPARPPGRPATPLACASR